MGQAQLVALFLLIIWALPLGEILDNPRVTIWYYVANLLPEKKKNIFLGREVS